MYSFTLVIPCSIKRGISLVMISGVGFERMR